MYGTSRDGSGAVLAVRVEMEEVRRDRRAESFSAVVTEVDMAFCGVKTARDDTEGRGRTHR